MATSHPCRVVQVGPLLSFEFANILLPDSKTNEPASHGFVNFRIKPIRQVKEGEYIENTAEIYFDFNAPVVTNTTNTYIGYPKDVITGIEVVNMLDQSVIYPNPFSDYVTITESNDVDVHIYSLDGIEQMHTKVENNSKLDLKHLPKGVYIYNINGMMGRLVKD